MLTKKEIANGNRTFTNMEVKLKKVYIIENFSDVSQTSKIS